MMWPLAEATWRLAGRALPTYEWRNIPVRVFPPGTRPPDGDDATIGPPPEGLRYG